MKRSRSISLGDSSVTLLLETTTVCLAVAAGFTHVLQSWAPPWTSLAWMVVVVIGFGGYRAALLLRRKYFPPAEPPTDASQTAGEKTGDSKQPDDGLQWSVDAPNVTVASSQPRPPQPLRVPGAGGEMADSNAPTMGLVAADLEYAPEDVTAALDIAELRPESTEDITLGNEPATLPSFAESTLSPEQRDHTLRTMKLQSVEGPSVPGAGGESGVAGGDDGPTEPMAAVSEDEANAGATVPMAAITGDATDADKTAPLDESELQRRMNQKRSAEPAAEAGDEAPAKPKKRDSVQMFDPEQIAAMKRKLADKNDDE